MPKLFGWACPKIRKNNIPQDIHFHGEDLDNPLDLKAHPIFLDGGLPNHHAKLLFGQPNPIFHLTPAGYCSGSGDGAATSLMTSAYPFHFCPISISIMLKGNRMGPNIHNSIRNLRAKLTCNKQKVQTRVAISLSKNAGYPKRLIDCMAYDVLEHEILGCPRFPLNVPVPKPFLRVNPIGGCAAGLLNWHLVHGKCHWHLIEWHEVPVPTTPNRCY